MKHYATTETLPATIKAVNQTVARARDASVSMGVGMPISRLSSQVLRKRIRDIDPLIATDRMNRLALMHLLISLKSPRMNIG